MRSNLLIKILTEIVSSTNTEIVNSSHLVTVSQQELSPMSALSDMQFRVGDQSGRQLTPLPNNTELPLEMFLPIILKAMHIKLL